MASPATRQTVLDREFLEVAPRVLEVAAALDRLDRAEVPRGAILRLGENQ